jgi:ribosome assembly protein 4
VAPIYQCAFSADSRLLVTGSKDTTLKVWSMATYKLAVDLPGHQDEVFAVRFTFSFVLFDWLHLSLHD